jgi:hypothetical protein
MIRVYGNDTPAELGRNTGIDHESKECLPYVQPKIVANSARLSFDFSATTRNYYRGSFCSGPNSSMRSRSMSSVRIYDISQCLSSGSRGNIQSETRLNANIIGRKLWLSEPILSIRPSNPINLRPLRSRLRSQWNTFRGM